MNILVRLLTILALLSLTACSTVLVDRTAGAAAAGKSYTETLKKVNELALQRSTNFAAEFLSSNRIRTSELLIEVTNIQKDRQRTVAESSVYLDKLAEYFSELEALSKGNASEATSASLGNLADALKKEPFKVSISEERKAALTGLAGFIAKQAHAAAVEEALRRDADKVAQAIAVSNEMLNTVSRWISKQETLEAEKAFQTKVQVPFTSGASLGNDWQTAWKDYVRGPAVNVVLGDAKKASEDLQSAWQKLLAGNSSFDEILDTLKNVQAGIDAVSALVNSK